MRRYASVEQPRDVEGRKMEPRITRMDTDQFRFRDRIPERPNTPAFSCPVLSVFIRVIRGSIRLPGFSGEQPGDGVGLDQLAGLVEVVGTMVAGSMPKAW